MGENTVTIGAGGCVLTEHWRGREGHEGHSLSTYDPLKKKWKQFFVANTGLTVEMEGKLRNGVMYFEGYSFDTSGKKGITRPRTTRSAGQLGSASSKDLGRRRKDVGSGLGRHLYKNEITY